MEDGLNISNNPSRSIASKQTKQTKQTLHMYIASSMSQKYQSIKRIKSILQTRYIYTYNKPGESIMYTHWYKTVLFVQPLFLFFIYLV